MTTSEPNKDWILDNIRILMKEKGIKVENLFPAIGISQGELSKILSGQRSDYFKHLPNFATALGVTFHQLVHPQNGQVFYNHGTIDNNSVGQAHIVEQKDETIKQLLHEKDRVIALLEKNSENMERKYKNVKEKLNAAELILKKM